MVASWSSNSWIISLKVLLISAGFISLAVTAKLAVPSMYNFAVNDLPAIWSVVVSWLEPPYLYVIINGIIITIVVTTRFQPNLCQDNQSQQVDNYNQWNAPPPSNLTSDLPPVAIHLSFGVMEATESPPVSCDINPCVTVEPPVAYESKRSDMDFETVAVGDEDDFITTKSTWNPPIEVQPEFSFSVKAKQLVTSRFSHKRRPAKNIPEGVRALRVLKSKKHETLDSTWKMITDGRHTTTARQFRKSDTFVNLHHDRLFDGSTAAANTKAVRKSETFKDRTTYENQNHYPQSPSENLWPASGEKLKKYLSPSHEELNRRVEAFIKKFNDDMRLQREESLNRYMEMVNRGAR